MPQPKLAIVIVEEAEAETAEAYDWYLEEAGPEIAHDFREAMRVTVGRIASRPLTYPKFEGEVRRCLFGRFPYAVLYQVTDTTIVIVAVMHLKRRPGYWKGRKQ